eukprot:99718_1
MSSSNNRNRFKKGRRKNTKKKQKRKSNKHKNKSSEQTKIKTPSKSYVHLSQEQREIYSHLHSNYNTKISSTGITGNLVQITSPIKQRSSTLVQHVTQPPQQLQPPQPPQQFQPPPQPQPNKQFVSASTVRHAQEFYHMSTEEMAVLCEDWIVVADAHECGNCSNKNVTQCCGGCKKVYYCNKPCQITDWKRHKATCKLIQELEKQKKSNHNINENQNGCNSIEKCQALSRLINALKYYQTYKNKLHIGKFSLERLYQYFNINKHQIINDYHHILSKHLNEDNVTGFEHNEQFKSIYKTMMHNDLYCDISVCAIYARNNREREKHNSPISVAIEILDCVHCYFLHSADVGYRMITKLQPEHDANDENKNENDIYWDEQLLTLKAYLKSKREQLKKMRGVNRVENNKFVTNVNTTDKGNWHDDEEEKKNESTDDNESKQENHDYSFGLRYCCWSGDNCDIKLKQKYASLKDELVSNTIYTLEANVFGSAYNKAQCLLNESNIIKNMSCRKRSGGRIYEIQPGSLLTINHILSIILYTDYDTLSYKFSSIFRTPQTTVSDEYLKQKGREYYNWIKSLTETVDCFGTSLQESNVNTLYHGVSFLYFDKFIAQFDAPTSTTTKLQVATIFAKNDGLILELSQYSQYLRYFNCSFISNFANEDERLFIQPPFAHKCSLKLVGIRMMKTNENYGYFFNVLAIFHQLINNENSSIFLKSSGLKKDVASKCVNTINKLMDISLNINHKEFPNYIIKCFKKWSDKITEIHFFTHDLKKYCKQFKIWNLNSNLIQYDKINKVFTQVTGIWCYQIGCINKSDLSSLLSMIPLVNSLTYSKLRAIVLTNNLTNTQFMFSKSEFAQYKSLFADIGWTLDMDSCLKVYKGTKPFL